MYCTAVSALYIYKCTCCHIRCSSAPFALVPDASCTYFSCVLHVSRIWQKRAWHSCTSCCSFIMRFCACTDVSHACYGCVSRASQTCPACISDACEVGAELCRMLAAAFAAWTKVQHSQHLWSYHAEWYIFTIRADYIYWLTLCQITIRRLWCQMVDHYNLLWSWFIGTPVII